MAGGQLAAELGHQVPEQGSPLVPETRRAVQLGMPRVQMNLPAMPKKGETTVVKSRTPRAGYRIQAALQLDQFLRESYRVTSAVAVVDVEKLREAKRATGRDGDWQDNDPQTLTEQRRTLHWEEKLVKTPAKMLMSWSIWKPHVEDLLRSVSRSSEVTLGQLWTQWYGPPYQPHPPQGEGPPTQNEWLATPECSEDEETSDAPGSNDESDEETYETAEGSEAEVSLLEEAAREHASGQTNQGALERGTRGDDSSNEETEEEILVLDASEEELERSLEREKPKKLASVVITTPGFLRNLAVKRKDWE